MKEETCCAQTPEQRKLLEIGDAAERSMLDKVPRQSTPRPPKSRKGLRRRAQQVSFVRLCGGDPVTLRGGDPELGHRIVNNGQQQTRRRRAQTARVWRQGHQVNQ